MDEPSQSIDLLERVAAAMSSGASARTAAAQFGVIVASLGRWSRRQHWTVGVAPGKPSCDPSRCCCRNVNGCWRALGPSLT